MSASAPPAAPTSADAANTAPSRIYLVGTPKVVFLYPTFLMSLFAGFYSMFVPGQHELIGTLFLAVFALNMIIFTFDFPRTTSLTIVFGVMVVVLGAMLLFRFNDQILPFVTNILQHYKPSANLTIYLSVSTILLLFYMLAWINMQLDYWEVTPNELLHHHGFLSDMKRYSAPNMKVDKEITDVFEYLLLGSGRLILHPTNEPRAIVLENVLFIDHKERSITKMLSALQVRVSTGPAIQE